MNDIVLSKLETARLALAEADIYQTKNILDVAIAAETYAKRQKLGEEAIHYATSIKVEALAQLGRMQSQNKEKNAGARGFGKSGVTNQYPTLAEMGLDKRTSKLAQDIASLPEDQLENVKRGVLSLSKAQTAVKKNKVKADLENISKQEAKAIQGVYDVIVIDPPWAMEKIEREVAPNQVAFEYPTMELEEIGALKIPCADNCHVFLWTTQKFLPSAFRLLDTWKMKYVLTFVWHKNGGFQPFGLPQYNCEFALYARVGTPQFIDFKDFMTCLNGKRNAHSEKPQEFYDTVRRVTAGRRLDMFNRRKIDGFDGWGKEAA